MKVQLQYQGQKWDILVLVLNDGSRPSVEFLDQLKQDDPDSFKHLVRVYTFHAEIGPLNDPQKSKPIDGYNGLFKFKSKEGGRLTYFLPYEQKNSVNPWL